jgi:CHASE1-domain containing sensor protein
VSEGSSLDWVSTIANLGIAGVLLVMLIKGWGIVLARELETARKQIEKLEAEKAALEERVRDSTALMIETVVPLMTRAVDVETGLLDRMKEEGWRERDDDPGGPRPSRTTRR